MQFLAIEDTTTLSDLSDRVGDRNVEHVLAANDLNRTPRIGKEYSKKIEQVYRDNPDPVSWQRKSTILNQFAGSADAFEAAALLDDTSWRVLSSYGTFPGMVKLPETVQLPDATDILGNVQGVGKTVYNRAMRSLATPPHTIDPSIFNEYSSIQDAKIADYVETSADAMQWFKIPWGEVTLFSTISNDSIDFPVYPEEYENTTAANYTTMPDLLYTYEPWFLYNSSGPRTVSLTFKFHRDMWTGDHRDGKANELIRFCEASCYPEYNGSSVNTDIVTLYIAGKPLISGIMTSVSPSWSGPLGLDNFYLACELSLTITEIAKQPLNYSTVKGKDLIG